MIRYIQSPLYLPPHCHVQSKVERLKCVLCWHIIQIFLHFDISYTFILSIHHYGHGIPQFCSQLIPACPALVLITCCTVSINFNVVLITYIIVLDVPYRYLYTLISATLSSCSIPWKESHCRDMPGVYIY